MAFSGFTNIICLDRIDSTNRYAADLARAGAKEGLVVLADSQSAGRGRRDRSWFAPAGSSLLCSFVLRPDLPRSDYHLVVSAFGLACVDAMQAVGEVTGRLKWPNDVIVAEQAPNPPGVPSSSSAPGAPVTTEERKVAGILSELVSGAEDHDDALVVGIGVNVSFAEGYPPPDATGELAALVAGATTLERASGRSISRRDLFTCFVESLETRYRAILSPGGRSAALAAYAGALSTLGRRVEVDLGAERLVGEAVGLDDDGRLVVKNAEGSFRVEAGDVVHLRAIER